VLGILGYLQWYRSSDRGLHGVGLYRRPWCMGKV